MRVVLIAVVVGLVLAGCSSQSQHGEDPNGELLPAPVRESSVVAPPEAEPVLVEGEYEAIPEMVGEAAGKADGQIGESVSGLASGQDGGQDTAVELAASPESIGQPSPVPETDTPPDSSITDSVAESLEGSSESEISQSPAEGAAAAERSDETELEGLVQVALPEDAEVLAAEDTRSESDVAAYLLDEAENSFQRENYEKARGQSERALTLEPTAARAYLIIARIELADGRPEKAAEMARQGLASSEESNEIFEQLNQILGEVAEMQPSTPAIPQEYPDASSLETTSPP